MLVATMKPSKLTFIGGASIQLGTEYTYTTTKGKKLRVVPIEFSVWGGNVAVLVRSVTTPEQFTIKPEELM